MPVNPIKLNQHASLIAQDLGKLSADDELRAKKVNGEMILYAHRRTSGIKKWAQNQFCKRKQKQAAAYQLLGQRLEHLPDDVRNKALSPTRLTPATAGLYATAFAHAEVGKNDFPPTLKEFLSTGAYQGAFAQFQHAAGKAQLDAELKFILYMDGGKSFSAESSRNFAATIMKKTSAETSDLNIKGTTIAAVAARFGVIDKKEMRELSHGDWMEKMKDLSTKDLFEALAPFKEEILKDLEVNLYRPFVSDMKRGKAAGT